MRSLLCARRTLTKSAASRMLAAVESVERGFEGALILPYAADGGAVRREQGFLRGAGAAFADRGGAGYSELRPQAEDGAAGDPALLVDDVFTMHRHGATATKLDVAVCRGPRSPPEEGRLAGRRRRRDIAPRELGYRTNVPGSASAGGAVEASPASNTRAAGASGPEVA